MVYDTHTKIPLHLLRSRRCASNGQRIVLHARDRGCTVPNCTVPGYDTQAHHVISWAKDGHSNFDAEVLACGAHNRFAEAGWTVRIRNGIVEWIPTPTRHRPTRTNDFTTPTACSQPPTPTPTPKMVDALNNWGCSEEFASATASLAV